MPASRKPGRHRLASFAKADKTERRFHVGHPCNLPRYRLSPMNGSFRIWSAMAARSIVSPDISMNPLSCRDRLEQALARIADPNGEGAAPALPSTRGKPVPRPMPPMRARAGGISLGPLDGVDRDHQGSVRRRRRADPRRIENSRRRGAPATADAPVVRRLRAGGGGDRRQDQHDRVRLFRHRRQSAFRHAGQSARSKPRARRLVVRSGCRRRRRHVRHRDRHRYRRLGPHPGGVVRLWSASSRAGNASRPTVRFP